MLLLLLAKHGKIGAPTTHADSQRFMAIRISLSGSEFFGISHRQRHHVAASVHETTDQRRHASSSLISFHQAFRKAQIQRAVMTAYGLSEVPEPNDVADALAIAFCSLQAGREAVRA